MVVVMNDTYQDILETIQDGREQTEEVANGKS